MTLNSKVNGITEGLYQELRKEPRKVKSEE